MEIEVFKVLLNMASSLNELVPKTFFKDPNLILQSINLIVLWITLYWTIKNIRITREMVENQLRPNVEINMVYDEQIDKTYFWFSNSSATPALVSVKTLIDGKENTILDLRIRPYISQDKLFYIKTSTNFTFPKDREITLTTSIKPAFNKNYSWLDFSKSYRFDKNKWNETSWNFPDAPYPG